MIAAHAASGRPSIAVLLCLLLFAACGPVDALNAITPGEGTERIADLRYAEGPRGGLDLYIPQAVPAGAPIIVFFYGGAWNSGEREDFRFVGNAFASRGYITAIPDYRVHPEITYPAFIEDGAAAVAAVREIIAERGLPADGPLILAGHSAGAHIAMMLALDPRWLGAQQQRPCDTIAAVLGLAGPYDFLPMTARSVIEVFGDAAQMAETQPITYASAQDPPAVLMTGTTDTTVLPRNSARLAEALREAGVRAELITYPDVGHAGLVAALAAPLRFIAPVLGDADAALRRLLATPTAGCG